MDFNNQSIIVGINVRDLERPSSPQLIQADIALIDKSSEVLQPLLYQLKRSISDEEELSPLIANPAFLTIEKESFLMMGEVMEINKAKKQIYLRNDNTVVYKHLIIASGLKQNSLFSTHSEELIGGLHALIEALRVRKKSAQALRFTSSNPIRKNPYATKIEPQKLQKAIDLNKILQESAKRSDSSGIMDNILASMEKRLYELQL